MSSDDIETKPGQAARDAAMARQMRADEELARRTDLALQAFDDADEDRPSVITNVNFKLSRDDIRRAMGGDTLPPKRGRHETLPPESLRVSPTDWAIVRVGKVALGSMHRHQRGWLAFAICLLAAVVLAILVLEGRITALREYVSPPRETPPWHDERHERRPKRERRDVAPEPGPE